MRKLKFLFCCSLLAFTLSLTPADTWGVAPVSPDPVQLTQPDGTHFVGYPRGSGYVDWMETAGGHTVLHVDGWWYYAEATETGDACPSSHRVGTLSEEELALWPRHLHGPPDLTRAPELRPRSPEAPEGVRAPSATTQPLLLLLVSFTDTAFVYNEASFVSLIYGASGSVKSFYTENSYGNFTVTPAIESAGAANDGAVSVAMTYAHPNFGNTYGASHDQLIRDAVLAADPYVNFAAYDTNGDGNILPQELSLLMIIAGYENSYGGSGSLTPRIWAHAGSIASASGATVDGKLVRFYGMFGERHGTSSGTHQATIGVMCHELGHHFLGLPDLYDTDGTSEGIGNWGLMGSGSWNYASGYSGSSPAHFTAWDKGRVYFLAFQDYLYSTSSVLLGPASSSASVARLWVDKYKHGEAFLLENRQKSGFDAGLPGPGLLITHVDDLKATNRDEAHKLVDVEEADGLTQMDTKVNRGDTGDPWPGSTAKTTFSNTSTPNTRDYTGTATGVAVTNIYTSGSDVVADLTPKPVAQMCDNVGYDDWGVSGSSRGYNSTVIWTALRVTNTTGMNTLDGVDLYQSDSGVTGYTIDFYLYSTISVAGTPGSLLHTQTGLAGVPGWNRLLLTTPQPFPPGEERAIVLKITGNTASAVWARYDPYGALSDRSYIDANGVAPFYNMSSYGDLNQKALLSPVSPAPPRVPDGTVRTAMKATKSDGAGSSIALTWDTTCAGASNYAIFYGMGSQLPATLGGTYSLAGAKCGLPAQGATTWASVPDPGSDSRRFLWWVIVATAGGTEGSWGTATGGTERSGPGAQGSSGSCGTVKNTSNSCS